MLSGIIKACKIYLFIQCLLWPIIGSSLQVTSENIQTQKDRNKLGSQEWEKIRVNDKEAVKPTIRVL